MEKAFDSIDHGVLFSKVSHYEIRGLPLDLINSYLSDRYQYVQISNSKSTLRPIRTGVPQGNILGPLLFLFYVNDIPQISPNQQTILFADDTATFISDQNYPELVSNLNHNLINVKSWTDANRVTEDVNKTQAIVFSNRTVDIVSKPVLIYEW